MQTLNDQTGSRPRGVKMLPIAQDRGLDLTQAGCASGTSPVECVLPLYTSRAAGAAMLPDDSSNSGVEHSSPVELLLVKPASRSEPGGVSGPNREETDARGEWSALVSL